MLCFAAVTSVYARHYGKRLCKKPGYHCLRVKRGQSWRSLFLGERERAIVMRLNRMNTALYAGMTIAVPDELYSVDHIVLSPFPSNIDYIGRTVLHINLGLHAFAAYDVNGNLIHWGPMSGGKGWCPDIGRRCRTPTGQFHVFSKGGSGCISRKFPVGIGGAPMPFCMFFYGGFAIHGSVLPGYHASHGCIRLFYQDAKWLNRNFVRSGRNGTKVIVRR